MSEVVGFFWLWIFELMVCLLVYVVAMRLHEIQLYFARVLGISEVLCVARAKKRQVCFRIEDSIVKEMEQIREKTGVPVSTQIELRLKGFTIASVGKEGERREVLQWYQSLRKDDDFANNVDKAVERMRELKLH